MSSNKNLFYNLYSNSNNTVSSGYICNSAVDEADTSFDITASSSGSAGVITDSNGNALGSINMSDIHAAGITQYNTETRILQPYSCCLLQGQEYGLACASYYYVIPKPVAEQENYAKYVSCSFDVIYNNFCPYTLHINVESVGTTDIDELINDYLSANNVEVSVSLQTLQDDIDGKTYDYLVFLSQKEGYFYYINNLRLVPAFLSEDYPSSPFSRALSGLKTIIYEFINKFQPVQEGKESEEYVVDCDLYKWLLYNWQDAIDQLPQLKEALKYLNKIDAAETQEEVDELYEKANAAIADTVYDSFFEKYAYDIENMNKIYDVIFGIKELALESNEYYQDMYWLREDRHLRIPLMKYPNGAFRGIVLIPDWPTNDAEKYEYRSLWVNHIKSQVKLYRPTKEHQFLPKIYGVLSSATLMYEEKEFRCACKNFGKLDSNCACQHSIPDGFADNLDTDYIDPYRPQHSIYEDTIYMGLNCYAHKKDIIGLFRYMQYVNDEKLWNKVGDAYMIIGKEDDPQSGDKNLPQSLVIYNPNPEPIRIKYMIFS